jgi:hypothetical protein
MYIGSAKILDLEVSPIHVILGLTFC